MQKLRLTLLLILGIFQISTACDDILSECSEALESEVELLTGLPNEQELRRICPVFLDVFDCVREKSLKCEGKTAEQAVVSSDDPGDAIAAQLFINMEALAKEICNEESDLRKSYIRTQPCTREYFSKPPKIQCKREAEAAYAAYRDMNEILLAEGEEELDEDAMCLMEAYAFACIAHDLQLTCNEEARNVLTGIFQRLKLSRVSCSVSSLNELKTNFLESLDLEPERRDVFSLAFNSLKKRKK
ncbi:uncharacterized protein LOC118191147 [Stegodyphus dumicola]|uniref:uncharacterized protein LOC118191147 n=1 Tax=Stegodyphus dumicola TaxID=202533 RepID=UPI0015AECDC6|nr:uncharacterized protein LOC118191147 [Stegodyphus dumicola]